MKCEHDFHYYPATNEDGWKCCACGHKPGEPAGYSPHLDRDKTERKVYAVLSDLHDAKIIYISNGTMGDCITASVSTRCEVDGVYDQYSIALFIMEALTEQHAKYWKSVSDGVIAGRDPRDRCPCGALATHAMLGASSARNRCSEHSVADDDDEVRRQASLPQESLPL